MRILKGNGNGARFPSAHHSKLFSIRAGGIQFQLDPAWHGKTLCYPVDNTTVACEAEERIGFRSEKPINLTVTRAPQSDESGTEY